jgi:hypothetical protein
MAYREKHFIAPPWVGRHRETLGPVIGHRMKAALCKFWSSARGWMRTAPCQEWKIPSCHLSLETTMLITPRGQEGRPAKTNQENA